MDYWHSDPLLWEYYSTRWGFPTYDDHELCKMVILESFSTGLSWLLILKKEENFDKAFDEFDLEKISQYNDQKINELMNDSGIVRHKGKIIATINNAKVMLDLQKEFGSFSNYIWSFTGHQVVQIKEPLISNELSDMISKDLKKRGVKFFGTVTCYSYLQAIGIINSRNEKTSD